MRTLTDLAAIIVRPKAPFIDWVRRTAGDVVGDISSKDIQVDPNVYLVDNYEIEKDDLQLVEENFKDIFEEELCCWATDDAYWPQDRDLKTFKQWFKAECHSRVLQLGNDEDQVQE